MRSPRCSLALLMVVGLLTSSAIAQTPTPGDVLALRPHLTDVEYDTPADAATTSACKIENVLNDQKRSIGIALRDGQGKMLRRFVIAHGGRRMDQWSYYQDGFEVYREDDLDGDFRLDECRWLNAGGTRIAMF
jgi:hypothetical protein